MSDSNELQKIVEGLYPLNLIAEQHLPQLLEKILRVSHDDNKTLIKTQAGPAKVYHYLLSGRIEVRHSMVDRSSLDHSSTEAWCQNPLEDLLGEKGGTIRSKSEGELLVVSVDFVDELLANSEAQELNVVHLEMMGDLPDDNLIDDEFEEEWCGVFLTTPLAAHLDPLKLHELFSRLEDREVEAGELIVQENTSGDAFFLIKKGRAEVSSGPGGGLKKPIDLWAGEYFGDESLVAHTTCNASVRMVETGVLGCLDGQAFDDVLRPALIKTLSEEELLSDNKKEICWVDVRLPEEFRHGHHESCVNYPISSLRRRLPDLDPNYRYLITPEGGRRSELATYLMRQTGLDAYLCA
mgnify:CR=1 FL=1